VRYVQTTDGAGDVANHADGEETTNEGEIERQQSR
jgi:hypothetical protein